MGTHLHLHWDWRFAKPTSSHTRFKEALKKIFLLGLGLKNIDISKVNYIRLRVDLLSI